MLSSVYCITLKNNDSETLKNNVSEKLKKNDSKGLYFHNFYFQQHEDVNLEFMPALLVSEHRMIK